MQEERIAEIYHRVSNAYQIFSENGNEWEANGLNSTPFKNLVAAALSTVTHSKRVIRACVALFAVASTPEEILKLDDERLKELIKPVAHYNRKTIQLKEMCRQLIQRHGGEVPATREALLALKGVGPKVADLIMNFNFGGDAIAVDTHIHRLLNRTGMVQTKSAEETALVINAITPAQYRKHAHEWLIQHGGLICTARKPKCEECIIRDLCEYRKPTSY